MAQKFRRVVTGHDENGTAIVASSLFALPMKTDDAAGAAPPLLTYPTCTVELRSGFGGGARGWPEARGCRGVRG